MNSSLNILNKVGFAGHVHFFQFEGTLRPVEIAISDVYSDKVFGTCVDTSSFSTTFRDLEQNEYFSKYVHKIKYPPQQTGTFSLENAARYLKYKYLCLDRGRGQWLAVCGSSQKYFFEMLGFRVVDVESELFPEKEDLEGKFNNHEIDFSGNEMHRFRVHTNGDDSQCAGLLSAKLANWIHSLKLEYFQDLICESDIWKM